MFHNPNRPMTELELSFHRGYRIHNNAHGPGERRHQFPSHSPNAVSPHDRRHPLQENHPNHYMKTKWGVLIHPQKSQDLNPG